MKKALRVIGIVLALLLVFLITAPFLFKDSIEKQVKKAVNENVNAEVEWGGLSLSLIKSFPNARLSLKDFSVVNKAPFEGDTLVAAQSIALDMGIMQLFKSGDAPLSINEFKLQKALVNLKINKEGVANYDIAISSEEEDSTKEASEENAMSLDVKAYSISDSQINYLDESSQLFLALKDFNHKGKGDFSASSSTLKTQTETLASFAMDGSEYFKNTALKLDADILIDLDQMKFTFEKNKALINQLPLQFDGFVQLFDDYQELDISMATPSSDFKNFLGLVPSAYANGWDGIKTSGNFSVEGRMYGKIDEEHIPKMQVLLKSENAYFKFPDLPKAVEKIDFEAALTNETGLMKDMNLDLFGLSFQIDQDVFQAHGKLRDLAGNIQVDMTAKGRLNLANIHKAYPLENDLGLNGILDADIQTSFAMEDIEKERYERVKSSGAASLADFNYESEELAHPIQISKANLKFKEGNVDLEKLDLQTGSTDASFTGKIQNLMGFMFKDQPIKGNFNLVSKQFSVNDFMVKPTEEGTGSKKAESSEKEETETNAHAEEEIKIPSFLDVVLNFRADKVLYDNLTLANAKGALAIKDEKASLNGITADIFGGKIGFNGNVSTKGNQPEFDVKLDLEEVRIAQSLQEMELLKSFAPVAQAFIGNLTTQISMKGDLTKDLSPIYSSLTGDGLAKIINASIQKDQLSFVSNLNDKLNFINMDAIELKDLVTQFSFENGGVNFKPFDFKVHKDIGVEIKGSHSFDNEADYVLDMAVPAKYLGKELGSQLAKLTDSDLENTVVDLPVRIKGNISQPKIEVDLKSATQDLANHLLKDQKKDLEKKAKEKGKELLDGILGGKDKNEEGKEDFEKKDKSKEEDSKEKAKDALDNIFGKKKK